MMTFFRLKLFPRSPWRTPWQADTLLGSLCATCARTHGPDTLRQRLIEPMLAGSPPFVLSDAFPGDLLPMPIAFRLADWPGDVDRKRLKSARWMTPADFQLARAGRIPPFNNLLADDDVFLRHTRLHNTLDRSTDATLTTDPDSVDSSGGVSAGGVFQRSETILLTQTPRDVKPAPNPAFQNADYLSLYFRILKPDIRTPSPAADSQSTPDFLLDLLHELSLTGFGADTATGRGQFDILEDHQPMPELDLPPSSNPDAIICLSTFQPGPDDPTHGLWESFPKFGKVGPDFGLTDVRKNTLILFRPGACFRASPAQSPRHFLGHAVPMNRLLPAESVRQLRERNLNILHPAFALTISATLSLE